MLGEKLVNTEQGWQKIDLDWRQVGGKLGKVKKVLNNLLENQTLYKMIFNSMFIILAK